MRKIKLESVELLYNAEAHFAAAEKYPDGLINELQKRGVESYEAMIWAFTETARQAELYRRFMGETPRRIITEREARMLLTAGQLRIATKMVMDAIIDGLGEGDGDEEIDEVLMELEKKTGKTG